MLMRLAALAACCIVVLAAPVRAEERVIEAEHTYVLGENDTRADARRTCYVEARRKAVEQAGTYVESETKVVNLSLTTDEVRAFAAAFVEAELVEEKFLASGGAFTVRCLVRAKVDTDTIGARLADFASNPTRREQLAGNAQARSDIDNGVNATSGKHAAPRGDALPDENAPPPVVDLAPKKLAAAKERQRQQTWRMNQAVRQVVSRGMSEGEVHELLGEPRVKKLNDALTSTYECQKYGDLWVVFRDGVVACTRTRLEYHHNYRSDCHCQGMAGATVFFD